MACSNSASIRFQPTLHLGSAIAVLIHGAPSEAGARDALASTALRHATGRPDIAIGRRPSGRPSLAPPHCSLGVSLSRRRSLLLAGFSPERAVGVDLEIADEGTSVDYTRLSRDHFARDEAEICAALPVAGARDLFFRLWVAKEAVLKATGRGIVDGMHWPDLAGQVTALREGGAVIEHLGSRRIAVATDRRCIAAGLSAYCALAVLDIAP
ncbi:MAG: 4'-phosphopantetheinyl transferase superfamily protein [Hyphomicrobiaceae bacterium]|nr:4'-phosphopantetheinyl transferase superfamily protein [Hyphomicrobiaceae bacterium]